MPNEHCDTMPIDHLRGIFIISCTSIGRNVAASLSILHLNYVGSISSETRARQIWEGELPSCASKNSELEKYIASSTLSLKSYIPLSAVRNAIRDAIPGIVA
jgi:hypothetical protein